MSVIGFRTGVFVQGAYNTVFTSQTPHLLN